MRLPKTLLSILKIWSLVMKLPQLILFFCSITAQTGMCQILCSFHLFRSFSIQVSYYYSHSSQCSADALQKTSLITLNNARLSSPRRIEEAVECKGEYLYCMSHDEKGEISFQSHQLLQTIHYITDGYKYATQSLYGWSSACGSN